jgi:uroporphyrin-III C-methyltransferase
MPGRVVFVGAGPGAADLITLRGAQWLRQAEVVLHDALTDPALRELGPQAQWIDVGKRGFTSHENGGSAQARINALLVEQARTHALVVRLKGGDPSLFGRLEEELQALAAAGIACAVVPGVTAALAAAAATARPLTRRGSGRSVAFTTAMTQDHALQARRGADTEVFYMAGRQLDALSLKLQQAGWPADTPASVVSRAGWPDMQVSQHTVAQLAQGHALHAGRPTVVVVGAGATEASAASPPP